MALGNLAEAFTSDLSDGQSRYLLVVVAIFYLVFMTAVELDQIVVQRVR